MFRRRTTDQVYATLQQVQRRITEGATAPGTATTPRPGTPRTGHPTPVPESATPSPGTGNYTPSSAPGTARVPDPALVAAAQAQLQPPPGRLMLHLPIGLASTLALVWLLTLVVAFLLGQMNGRPAAALVADHATAEAMRAEAPAARLRGGEWILVLKSVPNPTSDLRTQWQREVDRLNAYVRQNEARGWKPYFALREPASGQLEFVFGKADGQFGVDRAAFEDFAKLMATPPPKGGGYASAKWVKAE